MYHSCKDGHNGKKLHRTTISKQNGTRVEARTKRNQGNPTADTENQSLNKSASDNFHESVDGDTSRLDSTECEVTITSVPSVTSSDAPNSIVEGTLACHLKLEWLLFNINISVTPMISMVYFFVLYPYITRENPAYSAGALDINLHGISTVIVLFELILSALPVRLLHVIYPSCFGFIYVIFSVVYWAFDHENNSLYPNILDWNYPGITVGVLSGLLFIMLPLLQLCWFGVYRLRLFVFCRIYGHEYQWLTAHVKWCYLVFVFTGVTFPHTQ